MGVEGGRGQEKLQIGSVQAFRLHEPHDAARHVAGEAFAAEIGARHGDADAVQAHAAHERARLAAARGDDDGDVVLQVLAHAGAVQPEG